MRVRPMKSVRMTINRAATQTIPTCSDVMVIPPTCQAWTGDRAYGKAHGPRAEQAQGRASKMIAMAMRRYEAGELAVAAFAQGSEGDLVEQQAQQRPPDRRQREGKPDGHSGVLTSHKAIRPPRVKMAAWARFSISSTPKTSV